MGCLTWVRHSSCKSGTTQSYWCVHYFCVVNTTVWLPMFGIFNMRQIFKCMLLHTGAVWTSQSPQTCPVSLWEAICRALSPPVTLKVTGMLLDYRLMLLEEIIMYYFVCYFSKSEHIAYYKTKNNGSIEFPELTLNKCTFFF